MAVEIFSEHLHQTDSLTALCMMFKDNVLMCFIYTCNLIFVLCQTDADQRCMNSFLSVTIGTLETQALYFQLTYVHWWAYTCSIALVRRPPFSKIFSKTACPIEAKFIWSLSGMGERKFVREVWSTWPRWPPHPYMVKTLQKSSSTESKGQWPCGLVCGIGDSGPS